MNYSLSNKCAKNLCEKTFLVQQTVENVVTFFWAHFTCDSHG